jgi:hypothetical protein
MSQSESNANRGLAEGRRTPEQRAALIAAGERIAAEYARRERRRRIGVVVVVVVVYGLLCYELFLWFEEMSRAR